MTLNGKKTSYKNFKQMYKALELNPSLQTCVLRAMKVRKLEQISRFTSTKVETTSDMFNEGMSLNGGSSL